MGVTKTYEKSKMPPTSERVMKLISDHSQIQDIEQGLQRYWDDNWFACALGFAYIVTMAIYNTSFAFLILNTENTFRHNGFPPPVQTLLDNAWMGLITQRCFLAAYGLKMIYNFVYATVIHFGLCGDDKVKHIQQAVFDLESMGSFPFFWFLPVPAKFMYWWKIKDIARKALEGKQWSVPVVSCISMLIAPMLIAQSIAASTTGWKCFLNFFGMLNIMSNMWHHREMDEIAVWHFTIRTTRGIEGWVDPLALRCFIPRIAVQKLGCLRGAILIRSLDITSIAQIFHEAAHERALQRVEELCKIL